ncbi:MAG: hypothetical protein QM736_25205 [Vicinamibacterales bacterium]
MGDASTRNILTFSLPIAGSSLLTVLVMQADVLLLGTYVGRAPGVTPEAFGVFCAAAQVAGGIRKVRQVFDSIFAPIVANRAVMGDRAALRHTVSGPGRWVLAAQLPLVGALILAAGPIMAIYDPASVNVRCGSASSRSRTVLNTFAGLVETLLMIERPGLNLINASITVVAQIRGGRRADSAARRHRCSAGHVCRLRGAGRPALRGGQTRLRMGLARRVADPSARCRGAGRGPRGCGEDRWRDADGTNVGRAVHRDLRARMGMARSRSGRWRGVEPPCQEALTNFDEVVQTVAG